MDDTFTTFIFPSDQARADDEDLDRVCTALETYMEDYPELAAERDALAADAIRFRHLVNTGAFRVMSPDMGGNHTWTGMGRPVGRGSTIEDAIDSEIARRIDEGTYHGS